MVAPVYGPTCRVKAATTARLVTGFTSDGETKAVLFGSAWCSHSDQFCKERGRKLALARLLKLSPNRQWRREVWQKYFDRVL